MNGVCKYKMNGYSLDLIGERFGRLVVVRRAEDKVFKTSGKHKSQWYCDCDCGTKNKIILGASLTSGAVQSCGCLHREVAYETAKTKISHGKKYNRYDLSGEYGIGYDSNGKEFWFDLEDYDLIKDICWYRNPRDYILGHVVGDNKRAIKMHQLILNMDEDDQEHIVDHIYSDRKFDNRKSNLRITTQQNNTKNRVRPSNNTSGKTGVSWNKENGKWHAYIGVDGRQICLGYYDDIQEAINVRINAEKKFFGEFRVKNEH